MYEQLNKRHRLEVEQRLNNARKILQIAAANVAFRSLIDIGCGIGHFLEVARRDHGAEVFGVDGEFDTQLLNPELEVNFMRLDLAQADNLDTIAEKGPYDICVCLEVAEHLPPQVADRFVAALCRLSRFIVFSAAIPGQGGVGHVNERWARYWIEKFADHGLTAFDVFKPKLYGDPTIYPWLQQNLMLLAPATEMKIKSGFMQVVHPVIYQSLLQRMKNAR